MLIADLTLDAPFVAAPMAGVTSPAFRVMARRQKASLVYTEMVSAAGLVRGCARTASLCLVMPEERPVGLQIFGSDPEVMRRAALLVNRMPVDLVDVNLGCPAKKIRRQGAGSALLDDPPLAAEIVSAVVEASSRPVTVKLRLGFKTNELEKVLPGLLEAGAKAVCLHARTAKQGFGGQADWPAIRELKSWCPVPVIGNGDVRTPEQANAMLDETGCDLVMIGRGAIGNPWIFSRSVDLWAGREPEPVSVAQRRAALWEHMELARLVGGPNQALHFMRQFMMWYSKGLAGSTNFRRKAGTAPSLEALVQACSDFFDRLEHREREAA